MAIYSIPIIWESYKRYEVDAENLQEAVTKALRNFINEPDDEYIDDSFSIDPYVLEENPKETFDIQKSIEEIF